MTDLIDMLRVHKEVYLIEEDPYIDALSVGGDKVAIDEPALGGGLDGTDDPYTVDVGREGLRASAESICADQRVLTWDDAED